MNNGLLKPTADTADAATEFRGTINTWSLAAPLRLVPRGVAPDTTAPTHDVEIRAPHGGVVPAGVAWGRTIRRGEYQGHLMFSLALYVPEIMEREIQVAAFPRDGGVWELTVDRPRRPAAQGNGQDAPEPLPANEPLNDQIPF